MFNHIVNKYYVVTFVFEETVTVNRDKSCHWDIVCLVYMQW